MSPAGASGLTTDGPVPLVQTNAAPAGMATPAEIGAVGEPPLMLAISVREALRAAVAAFGRGGIVELATPATPEAVFWAIEKVRGAVAAPIGRLTNQATLDPTEAR
jgi:xanthine dehydrogenase large subunit